MFEDKFKAFKFTIIVCLFSAVISGVIFLTLGYKYMGIIFVLNLLAMIINMVAYYYEKEKKHE